MQLNLEKPQLHKEVDLNSIPVTVRTPIPCTSETLVIIYQTTFLHKSEDCNHRIIILRAADNILTYKNQCKIVIRHEGK
jgi:hypothetical protein